MNSNSSSFAWAFKNIGVQLLHHRVYEIQTESYQSDLAHFDGFPRVNKAISKIKLPSVSGRSSRFHAAALGKSPPLESQLDKLCSQVLILSVLHITKAVYFQK